MRLGQLARKLAISPTKITEFLSTNQIQIEEGSNARLLDDHVKLILQHFSPGLIVEENSTEEPVEVIQQASPPVKEIMSVEIPQEANSTGAIQNGDLNEASPTEAEKIEVIKAPKVELPGLRVLGKIELPDPKKKEEPTVSSEVPTENVVPKEDIKPRQERRKESGNKKPFEERPRKNPIALQREREAREAEKQRRIQAERDKEKRTQNYLKRVKPAAPTKSARILNEAVEEMNVEPVEVPKTWFGRFMKWLRT